MLDLLNTLLEHMPFINDPSYRINYVPVARHYEWPVFWNEYKDIYVNRLAQEEKCRSTFLKNFTLDSQPVGSVHFFISRLSHAGASLSIIGSVA